MTCKFSDGQVNMESLIYGIPFEELVRMPLNMETTHHNFIGCRKYSKARKA